MNVELATSNSTIDKLKNENEDLTFFRSYRVKNNQVSAYAKILVNNIAATIQCNFIVFYGYFKRLYIQYPESPP